MNDSTHIEYCATILETNPACVMSVLNNRKSESDDSSRYILPSCTILCRAWANNGAMSRYLGPACHALSAILRGSPARARVVRASSRYAVRHPRGSAARPPRGYRQQHEL